MRDFFIVFLTVEKKDKHYTILIMHLFNKEDIYNIGEETETILKGQRVGSFSIVGTHTVTYYLNGAYLIVII
jgi:hypothetical protein